MPFDLKNAGMSFQRFIDRVLAGLPFVLVYLDDILVASPDRLSHAEHLRCVLQCLRDNGLVLNRAKCEFFHSEVEFLGLRVTADGVAPLPDQLAAVRDFPQPNKVKELQAFSRSCQLLPPIHPFSSEDTPTSHRRPERRQEGL